MAAGWALVQAARTGGHEVTHVRDLVDLAVQGDGDARHLVRVAGRRIGEVVASAVNLLNPEAVVVGGDLARVYDIFVAGLRESLYCQASALSTRELGDRPGHPRRPVRRGRLRRDGDPRGPGLRRRREGAAGKGLTRHSPVEERAPASVSKPRDLSAGVVRRVAASYVRRWKLTFPLGCRVAR